MSFLLFYNFILFYSFINLRIEKKVTKRVDINYIDLEDYQYRIFYDLQSYWIIIEESERLKRHHFFLYIYHTRFNDTS